MLSMSVIARVCIYGLCLPALPIVTARQVLSAPSRSLPIGQTEANRRIHHFRHIVVYRIALHNLYDFVECL